MQWIFSNEHRWAVILAGGEGVRLRTLTQFVSGDDRPKQFCSFLGERSLLAQTRDRVGRCIPEDNSLFVLLQSHELFYERELKGVPPARLVEQPSNRGTLPGVLSALFRIRRLDPRAVVAFFPSDHHYRDEDNFLAGVDLAFGCAEKNRDSVVLIAAPASYPATDYGWIEAVAGVSGYSGTDLLKVRRFWEKPTLEVAQALLERGCVWNTFVMVGTAEAFLCAIESATPDIYSAFESLQESDCLEDEARMARTIYAGIPTCDLSKCVLARVPERLGVFCLGDVGWSDLGNPERLVEVVRRIGEPSDWLNEWRETNRPSLAKGPAGESKASPATASA